MAAPQRDRSASSDGSAQRENDERRGEGRDTAVVLVAAAVEHDCLNAQRLGALGDQLADLAGGAHLVALDALGGLLQGGGRAQGVADGVVHDLSHHVAVGPGDHQAGTLGRAGDVLAHALVTDLAGDGAGVALAPLDRVSHGHLPAFPTLRRTFSPA